jgi:hypothetical protein
VLVLDIREYGLAVVRRYVAETIRWAAEYPFVIVHFLTGPSSQGPARREEVAKAVEAMARSDGIVYTWQVPRQNQSLVVCRFKERNDGNLRNEI